MSSLTALKSNQVTATTTTRPPRSFPDKTNPTEPLPSLKWGRFRLWFSYLPFKRKLATLSAWHGMACIQPDPSPLSLTTFGKKIPEISVKSHVDRSTNQINLSIGQKVLSANETDPVNPIQPIHQIKTIKIPLGVC